MCKQIGIWIQVHPGRESNISNRQLHRNPKVKYRLKVLTDLYFVKIKGFVIISKDLYIKPC